jgi:hypothetical protein
MGAGTSSGEIVHRPVVLAIILWVLRPDLADDDPAVPEEDG